MDCKYKFGEIRKETNITIFSLSCHKLCVWHLLQRRQMYFQEGTILLTGLKCSRVSKIIIFASDLFIYEKTTKPTWKHFSCIKQGTNYIYAIPAGYNLSCCNKSVIEVKRIERDQKKRLLLAEKAPKAYHITSIHWAKMGYCLQIQV